MQRDETKEAVCLCGHGRSAHEHYRGGTECSVCLGCPRFRPARRPWRLVALLLRRPRS